MSNAGKKRRDEAKRVGPGNGQHSPEYRPNVHGRMTQAKRFFKSIRWDVWWDEFCNTLKPSGEVQYPTAWNFIIHKLKNPQERKIAYWAIGPRPTFLKEGHVQDPNAPVPWLGDWTTKRANLTMYSSEKLQSLQHVIGERLDGLEAGKGIANLTLDDIARFHKLQEQIDKFFGGIESVFPESGDESTLTEKQRMKILHMVERRFDLYTEMQEKVMAAKMRASRMYLKCHGIADDDVTALAALAMSGMVAGVAKISDGNGKHLMGDGPNNVQILLAQSMVRKSQLLGTKLPDEDVQNLIDVQVKKTMKEND